MRHNIIFALAAAICLATSSGAYAASANTCISMYNADRTQLSAKGVSLNAYVSACQKGQQGNSTPQYPSPSRMIPAGGIQAVQ